MLASLMDEEKTQKKGSGKLIFLLVGILALIGLSVAGTVYVARAKPEVLGLSKGSGLVKSEVDSLVVEIEKLVDLPDNERPTVATVTDIEKIKNQPFFKNAKNGDKLVIYTTSRKTILYRPSEHRVIEFGAVNIQQRATASVTPQAEKDAKKVTPTPSKPTKEPTPKKNK